MMKLVLESTNVKNEKRVDLYKIGNYTVKKVSYMNGSVSHINVIKERIEYLPEIYWCDDLEGNTTGFEIQTTSYGSLSAEETMKVVAGLNEAIEVVKVLTEEFVK